MSRFRYITKRLVVYLLSLKHKHILMSVNMYMHCNFLSEHRIHYRIEHNSRYSGNLFSHFMNSVHLPLSLVPLHSWGCLFCLNCIHLIFSYYFRLPWVFVAAQASSGCGEHGLLSSCDAWAACGGGFSCGRAWALERGLRSCSTET